MSRIVYLPITVGLAAILGLGGCGASAPNEAAEDAEPLVLLTPYAETDAPEFTKGIERFEKRSGIDVEVRSVAGDLVDALLLGLAGDDPPDMAVIPQPGVVRDLAHRGFAKPIPSGLLHMNANVTPGLRVASTVDSSEYGTWTVETVGSVWYRPDVFAANGWSVPTTFDEFTTLLTTIAATDYRALCLGTQAGGATGWSITDYVELVMLANVGAPAYDRWTSLELPFSSPEVMSAMTTVQSWLTNSEVTYGTADDILEREVDASIVDLAETDPPCVMAIGSDWVLGAIDDRVTAGDVALWFDRAPPPIDGPVIAGFDFPGPAPDQPARLLGGDQLVSFTDDSRAWDLMSFVAAERWEKSNHDDQGGSKRELADATSPEAANHQRFDGSDLMPTDVGTNAMWAAMTRLLRGESIGSIAADLDTVAETSKG